MPLRSAVFEVYRRHRAAQGSENSHWGTCFDDDEGLLRVLNVDLVTRLMVLSLGPSSDMGQWRFVDLTEDVLAQGVDKVALTLRFHMRADEVKAVQDPVFRHWWTMARHLLAAVEASTVALHARLGSPLADFVHVPPDTFAHYKVTDWRNGIVESPHGPTLFSPHLDLECVGPYTGQAAPAAPDYVAERQAKARRRPRPMHDFVADFLARTYPQGVPPGTTLKELTREVSNAYAQRFNRRRDLSIEAVRKALAEQRATNNP